MGNNRFRLSKIFRASSWLARKSVSPKSPRVPISQHCVKEQATTKKALPVQTFDEMLLLSSSSRSLMTERNALPPLIVSQPRRSSAYKSSNSDDSPRRRKVHSKCCHGVRVKAKSPRLITTNTHQRTSSSSSSSSSSSKRRRGLSERSVTVVKSSADPETDFKESMVEMIVENNISDLDGLEELLVSYLVLNSEEFHEVIVSVFKEIVIGLFLKQKKC